MPLYCPPVNIYAVCCNGDGTNDDDGDGAISSGAKVREGKLVVSSTVVHTTI